MSSATPMELPLEWHLWLTWHVYKVCSQGGCPESAVLAAIDLAIRDGVDVISLSLGSFPKKSFLQDALQIATFWAVQQGIFVSCSAGNVGPFDSSVSGPAPWVLTVGQAPLIEVFELWPSSEIVKNTWVNLSSSLVTSSPSYSLLFTPNSATRRHLKEYVLEERLCFARGLVGHQGFLEVKK